MPVTVVVGAQWGDEGKAKVIDLLAKEHGYVVRYQGGHNAGHTVVVGGDRYALQLIPSGILYDHVVPVIGNGVVVDLPTLFGELDALESRGDLVPAPQGLEPGPPHLPVAPGPRRDRRGAARRRQDRHDAEGHRAGLRRQGPAGRACGPATCSTSASFADHVKARAVAENREIEARRRRAARRRRDRRAVHGARRPPRARTSTDTVALLHDALAARPARCCSRARRPRSSTSTTARIRT